MVSCIAGKNTVFLLHLKETIWKIFDKNKVVWSGSGGKRHGGHETYAKILNVWHIEEEWPNNYFCDSRDLNWDPCL